MNYCQFTVKSTQNYHGSAGFSVMVVVIILPCNVCCLIKTSVELVRRMFTRCGKVPESSCVSCWKRGQPCSKSWIIVICCRISELRRDLQAAIITKANLHIGPAVENFGGETFLSQEVAINLMQEYKLAFKRCEMVRCHYWCFFHHQNYFVLFLLMSLIIVLSLCLGITVAFVGMLRHYVCLNFHKVDGIHCFGGVYLLAHLNAQVWCSWRSWSNQQLADSVYLENDLK